MYITTSATTQRYNDTMIPGTAYFNGTITQYSDCSFIIEDTRLTPEKLLWVNFRIYYESVGRSRALAKIEMRSRVLCTQVHHTPVRSIFFRMRCPRIRPPQRWCVGKYRRKR